MGSKIINFKNLLPIIQNEYFVQFGEEIIELVSQPYIPADVTRIMKYSSRMASYLYKFMQISAYNPQWYKEILAEGRKRCLENTRNLAFEKELLADYGFKVDPMVCISIPELEQISMELEVL